MSQVRVLVGTRKGAFILNSDGQRRNWDVSGPHFAGWEMYHLKGSPADPNRLYASQSNGWFGQLIQRSNDGGKTWGPMGNKFEYDGVPGTHQWYDGTPHPWKFARVWHLEPPSPIPIRFMRAWKMPLYFVRPTAPILGRNSPDFATRLRLASWQPGAGGMCLHTIILDPRDQKRISIAISAAGAFRTDDAGKTWRPINRGLKSEGLPEPHRRSRPLCAPHRRSPFAARGALHAETLGCHAQR